MVFKQLSQSRYGLETRGFDLYGLPRVQISGYYKNKHVCLTSEL